MPTPRRVLVVSSSASKFQSRRTALRTGGGARGTTLHSAAPSTPAVRTNFAANSPPSPLNHVAVGMSECLTTRRELARPRCVFVLPMSKSRIMMKSPKAPGQEPKEIRAPKCEPKALRQPRAQFGFRISAFVRISDFGFWISLFQGHVAAADAFQVASVSAQQQRAVFTERFRASADLPVTDANRHR